MSKPIIPSAGPPRQHHLNRQIPPLAHTPMYVWHKYWARKTWNVVGEHVSAYCPEGGVVLDPFAGSGISVIEAVRRGRRAIAADIVPVATEIIRLTLKPVKPDHLLEAFLRVERRVKGKILELYTTTCRRCRREIVFDCAIWRGKSPFEIRYAHCPSCGDRREKNCALVARDRALLRSIERSKIKAWYPDGKLMYPNGEPFKERQRYDRLSDLFTRRNLTALAWLMEAIESEASKQLQEFLKIAFSSMVHLCTRMMPISEAGHFTPFSSAWVQHSYWYPSGPYMEQNVWHKFESAVNGPQGLLRAKEESNAHFREVKVSDDWRDVIEGRAQAAVCNRSALDLMREMKKDHPEGCVDYIFTDPPYGSAIQYGELAYLWVSWLRLDERYLEKILSSEIVENRRQGKTFETYEDYLRAAFKDMYDVLKPERRATVTFHNPTFRVRNATIRAAVHAGFLFEHQHHQELARPSPKSLLQPFGSAQGDYYFRFSKPMGRAAAFAEQTDERRFEKVVVDTAVRVIAERGEETPYTILINVVDPELAKNGFFRRLKSGLDVETVLQEHVGREFVLVDTRIGSLKGKSWWLQDPSQYRIDVVPLSERVEQTVLRKLQEKAVATFTDVWDAVSTEFPNSLTTDSTSIREALKVFADPIERGTWRIKPDATTQAIRDIHSEIIAILAEEGRKQGFDVWIGRPEQGRPVPANIREKAHLSDYVSLKTLKDMINVADHEIVERMDVLWSRDRKISIAFEVEATTAMTESLSRGSCVARDVPKYLVIPQGRAAQLDRKMRSPLFVERYKADRWGVLYFEKIRRVFMKGLRIRPDEIAGVKISGPGRPVGLESKQLRLFDVNPSQEKGHSESPGGEEE